MRNRTVLEKTGSILMRVVVIALIAATLIFTIYSILVTSFQLDIALGWALPIMSLAAAWAFWSSVVGYFVLFGDE